jgi:hypothetical protein
MSRDYRKSRFPAFFPLGFPYFVPLILIFFLFPQKVYSADVTLAWYPPIIQQNLAGYTVFYREEGRTYDYSYPAWEAWLEELENPDDPRCTIYNLDDGITYCFVARSFNFSGEQSGDSNEVCYQSSGNLSPIADAGPDQTVDEGGGGGAGSPNDRPVQPADDGGGGGGGCFIATASTVDMFLSLGI